MTTKDTKGTTGADDGPLATSAVRGRVRQSCASVVPSVSLVMSVSEGFTLIELMVVLALITTLAAIGMNQYRNSQIYAKEAVLKEDLFRMRDAIDQYYADKNQYPATLDSLVSDGYLRKLPDDPFTKSSSSWQTVPAEPDPNNPTTEPGVYDVKSGAEGTALDGSKYSDW